MLRKYPSQSKEHLKIYHRKYYLKNKERIIQRTSIYTKVNRDRLNKCRRKWQIEKVRTDPEYRNRLKEIRKKAGRKYRAKRLLTGLKRKDGIKQKARDTLRTEVRAKRIIVPTKCDICNSTDKIQGHHENYNNPLKVMWICQLCHQEIHRLKR